MVHLINIILILLNVSLYAWGLSMGVNYWWNLLVAGFILGLEVATIIIGMTKA